MRSTWTIKHASRGQEKKKNGIKKDIRIRNKERNEKENNKKRK